MRGECGMSVAACSKWSRASRKRRCLIAITPRSLCVMAPCSISRGRGGAGPG